jgi:hypothetical protein
MQELHRHDRATHSAPSDTQCRPPTGERETAIPAQKQRHVWQKQLHGTKY